MSDEYLSVSNIVMQKIKNLRLSYGMSQKYVANYLNISQQAYGHYENFDRQPDIDTIFKLAKLFNVSLNELIEADGSLNNTLQSRSFIDFIIKLQQKNVTEADISTISNEKLNIIATIIKTNG